MLKQISNPGGLYGLAADFNDGEVMTMINGSGGTVKVGDLVIIRVASAAPAAAYGTPVFTTSTTANDQKVIGVVAGQAYQAPDSGGSSLSPTFGIDPTVYAANAEVPIQWRGVARVNIAANTVAAGDPLVQSGVVKVAQTNTATITGAATNNTFWGSVFAIALEANTAKETTNNTIRALLLR